MINLSSIGIVHASRYSSNALLNASSSKRYTQILLFLRDHEI